MRSGLIADVPSNAPTDVPKFAAPKKRGPGTRPGPGSLIAVITLRHLLREEKQGNNSLATIIPGEY
jgi:hypothetical protein